MVKQYADTAAATVAADQEQCENEARKRMPMETTETVDSGPQVEIRGKLEATIERARAACQRLEEKTVEAAKLTDKTIREHPYQAVGFAFGLGLLIGVLAMRSRRD
jgi:ElaB/YqjD/DUF883 family membrane-anchored ribosome-binding protein